MEHERNSILRVYGHGKGICGYVETCRFRLKVLESKDLGRRFQALGFCV